MFLARWPADKAMRHARDRIRELTARSRLLLPPEAVVQDINMFLRGWVDYFRYGHSTACLAKIRVMQPSGWRFSWESGTNADGASA